MGAELQLNYKWTRLWLILTGMWTMGGAIPIQAKQTQPVVIHWVTLIDGESDEAVENATVIFQQGRISSISMATKPPFPEGAVVIDGTGKFLIPGLWDMHAHLSYWGEDALGMLVNAGVTSIRELGGDPDEIEGWMARIQSGEIVGPSMIWCGPYVEGLEAEDEYRLKVGTTKEARVAAHTLKDRGVDFIKIQPRIARDLVEALVSEANSIGLSVVGHVPQGLSAIEASALGLRSIEHLSPYLQLSQEELEATIQTLLKNGTWVSPALFSILAPVLASGEDPSLDEKIQKAYSIVQRFYEAGVPLLLGANFAYRDWPQQPGSGLHGEMVVFEDAGIPAMEVI